MTAPWINQLGVYQLPIAAPPGSPVLDSTLFSLPNPLLGWADYGMDVSAEWRFGGSSASLTDLTGEVTLVPHGTAPTFGASSVSLVAGGLNGLDSNIPTQHGQTLLCVAQYEVPATTGQLNVLFEGKDVSATYQALFLANSSPSGTGYVFAPAGGVKTAQPTLTNGQWFFYAFSQDTTGWTSFVSGVSQTGADVLTIINPSQFMSLGNSWVNNSNYTANAPTLAWAMIVPQTMTAEEMACVYFQQKVQQRQLYSRTVV